jgi:hypothetical protein
MKNPQIMPVSVEIESEALLAQVEMIESLAPLCSTINQEGSSLLCTPDPGHLYDVILLLFHNRIDYKLRTTPANNAPTIL